MTNGTKWRMFAACRAGECGDCIEETYVSERRDGEPAVDARVIRERCGCDCHRADEPASIAPVSGHVCGRDC